LRTVVRSKVQTEPGFDLTETCELYLQHRSRIDSAGAAAETRLTVVGAYGGAYHSFLLTNMGSVYAFGLNNMGQLGLGSLEPVHTGVPMLVSGLENKGVTSLVGGEHHSLALTDSGEVYAFGRGDNNQLGFGDGTEQQLAPRLVDAFDGVAVRKLSSGSNQNVAVTRSGDLYAWGFGEMGQLCNGKSADEASPALVEQPAFASMAVLSAASGAQHSVIVAVERSE